MALRKPEPLDKRSLRNQKILYFALALTTVGGILAKEASSRQAPLTASAQVESMGSGLTFWLEARQGCGAESTFEGSDSTVEARRIVYREALEKSHALGLDGTDGASLAYREAHIVPALSSLNHSFSCRKADQEVRSVVARAVAAEFAGTPLPSRDGFESNPVLIDGHRCASLLEVSATALPLLGLKSAPAGEIQRALIAHLVATFVRKHGSPKDGTLDGRQRDRLRAMVGQVLRRFSGLERELATRAEPKLGA